MVSRERLQPHRRVVHPLNTIGACAHPVPLGQSGRRPPPPAALRRGLAGLALAERIQAGVAIEQLDATRAVGVDRLSMLLPPR